MTARVPVASQEYIEVEVTGTPADVDLSTATVEFAFTADGADPLTGDWHAGIWLRPAVGGVLLGGTGLVLALGRWWVWLRLTLAEGAERPVRQAGIVELT